MLYCPGKGQVLLSALGVNLECHASSIFLVLKPPLSIIDTHLVFFTFLSFYPLKAVVQTAESSYF